MTMNHQNNGTPGELRAISDALDRLGAAERAEMPSGLEARVAEAVAARAAGGAGRGVEAPESSQGELGAEIGGFSDRLSALGDADRRAAPAGLEARVFRASVGRLAPAREAQPVLARIGVGVSGGLGGGVSGRVEVAGGRTANRSVSWFGPALRIAAVIAIVAGGAAVYRSLSTTPASTGGRELAGAPPAGDEIGSAAGGESEVDAVLAVLASIDRSAGIDDLDDLVSEVEGLAADPVHDSIPMIQ